MLVYHKAILNGHAALWYQKSTWPLKFIGVHMVDDCHFTEHQLIWSQLYDTCIFSLAKRFLSKEPKLFRGWSPCRNYVHSQWDVHSRWGTSPFLVRMWNPHMRKISVPGGAGASLFPVKICIPGAGESHRNKHPHRDWQCDSSGIHIVTGNNVPYCKWGCDSLGMRMCLTGNGVGTHKESTVSPRVHIIYTGCWY